MKISLLRVVLVCRVVSPRAEDAEVDVDVWPADAKGAWLESSVSTEFPRERVIGTDRKGWGWLVHFVVDDEIL